MIRKSERLKSTIAMSTQEKIETMAKKRNLEGTPLKSKSNLFSDLHVDAIKQLSSDMGIHADSISLIPSILLRTWK